MKRGQVLFCGYDAASGGHRFAKTVITPRNLGGLAQDLEDNAFTGPRALKMPCKLYARG